MIRLAPHRIVALGYRGMSPFELSIVIEVFGLSRPELDVRRWYSVDVCAIDPGVQPAVGGISITVPYGIAAIDDADTVIVPGWPVYSDVPEILIDAIRRAHSRGARIVSICSGAFVLAAAGILERREVATHWLHADLLAARYPNLTVNRDVLYTDEANLLTSAGSAAGIDLCLHLVRRDHGAAVANQVARRLVVPAHREGGQTQFIERPVAVDGETTVHDIIDWMDRNLSTPMTVTVLARRAHMSERHFTRRFREITGESPVHWLIGRRVDASLELLEHGATAIEDVARTIGFANAITYRHHFRSRMHTTPMAYRRAFRA
jgi:AraC family transcriptional activator FtrA